jgi:hypothetical protein
MKRFIEVRTRFAAIHNWPDAPAVVEFLRQPHRHEFHVTLQVQVLHNDRDLEFFMVKGHLDTIVLGVIGAAAEDRFALVRNVGSMSCETMAEELLKEIILMYGDNRICCCTVTEDGENGGCVVHEPD